MRRIWIAAAAALGLLGCDQPGPDADPAAPPVPARIELAFSGHAAPVLDSEDNGEIALERAGDSEPVLVAFRNGQPADIALAPGTYRLTRIGALQCRGVKFEVDPDSGARALGTLRGDVIRTRYFVALMASRPATAAQVAALAQDKGLDPATIDAAPIPLSERAPCFLHRGGPGETWRDRPLGEQVLLAIGFAGFCAVALAAGGFCAF